MKLLFEFKNHLWESSLTRLRYAAHWKAARNEAMDYIALICFNTLRPRQNRRRFSDDSFKCIFLNENIRISIKISLKFLPKGPINNNPALVQIMAWHWSGDKPLSEPMMVGLLMHICVTRPQWVNLLPCDLLSGYILFVNPVVALDQRIIWHHGCVKLDM